MPRKRKGQEADRRTAALPPDESQPEPVSEKAADKASPGYSDLVLLVHAANLAEADLYKTELEMHGIPAVLEGESGNLAGIGAGVPVLVPEEFADQAAERIAELESAKPEGRTVAEKENLFEEEDDELESLDKLEDLDEDEDAEEDEDWEDDDDEDEDEDDEKEDEDEEDEDWDDDDDEDWDDDDDL
jgi:hypothetical protein